MLVQCSYPISACLQMLPLKGVRVLDFSVMISGPLATMVLADQGAEVIKIEAPSGDLMRYVGSARNGMAAGFAFCNRGKRSVVLNLKEAQSLVIVRALIAQTDVLVHNFRPGAMKKLGLAYDQVQKLNPALIYVSISGYGPTGPFSALPVYDGIMQAVSGIASTQVSNHAVASAMASEDHQAPSTDISLVRNLLVDKLTGHTAAQAICAALFARERSTHRLGQHISLSMLDTAVAFLWSDAAMDLAMLEADTTRKLPLTKVNYFTSCLTGRWCVILSQIGSGRAWVAPSAGRN